MRCRNCGWENPDTHQNCEKCGAGLEMPSNAQQPMPDSTVFPHSSNTNSPARATVRETDVFKMAVNSPAFNEPSNQTNCPCCGYPVAPGAENCPACGTRIAAAQYSPHVAERPQHNQGIPADFPNPVNYPRGNNPTVSEIPRQGLHCINCGSLLAPNAKFCAACGAPVGNQPMNVSPRPKKPFGGTISGFTDPGNMGMGSFCTLKPIAWGRERIEYQPISYTGERIVLNRSNTDANNQTITSNEQASLTYKDGEWYLEDLSPNRSTMIRVDRPVKLNDGDIIMLGNRMFEFNK